MSAEVKEMFQYIQRYAPQTIELETKLRPFIPEYIAAVGDIDAFLKVSLSGILSANINTLRLDIKVDRRLWPWWLIMLFPFCIILKGPKARWKTR